MKKLLLGSALALAACGDSLEEATPTSTPPVTERIELPNSLSSSESTLRKPALDTIDHLLQDATRARKLYASHPNPCVRIMATTNELGQKVESLLVVGRAEPEGLLVREDDLVYFDQNLDGQMDAIGAIVATEMSPKNLDIGTNVLERIETIEAMANDASRFRGNLMHLTMLNDAGVPCQPLE